MSNLLTRRRSLYLGLGTLASMGVYLTHRTSSTEPVGDRLITNQAQASDKLATKIALGESSLKEHAAAKGLIYGAAAKKVELKNNRFADHVIQECDMVVPKWEFRWNWLNPNPDEFDFTRTDSLVQWVKERGMLLRGHALIYQNSMPKWFWGRVNRRNIEKTFLNYIDTVVSHYAGQMHSWDVVNEAIYPQHGRADGLRNTRWLQWLGADFFDLVFSAAAEADPQALLVYNDTGMDRNTDDGEAIRTATLKLLEKLKSQGTPIHALGIQSHIWARDTEPLNQKKIRAFVGEVAQLGLKIMVTELDVKDRHLSKDITVRDRIVAQAYEDYLSAVLDEPAVIAVNTWGLSDRYTWLEHPKRGARDDGAPVRPLPLDEQFQRKPAWYAMARAFANAPKR